MHGTPAGWYPDPWSSGQWRWWDGRMWTAASDPGQWSAPARRWFPDIPTLPLIAGLVMYAGIVVSVLVDRSASATSGGAQLLLALVSLGLSIFVAPGIAVLVSIRWGTRRFFRDTGLTFQWWDLLLGPAVAVVAWVATLVVGWIVTAIRLPSGTNTDGIKESVDQGGAVVLVLVLVLACVVAPITEELAMRGVLLRGLRSKVGVAAAIGVQGVMFGALHILPSLGWANVGLVVILSTTGIVFGLAAWMTGRIGTTIVAHAIFNGGQIALLLLLNVK